MTAFIFPGQGSQFLGMSKDFFDNFKAARDIFEIISDTTKINIKAIIFDNNSNILDQTRYTQLSIFCTSISIFEVLKKEVNLEINKPNINFMLGHSLGEYTALSAANILSIKDCSFLLKIRGELMQNAYEPNKSSMAAIIGIDINEVEKIIDKNNLKLDIANDNSPLQIVISGLKKDLLESENIFKASGVKKFILLNVSAAFHSYLMNEAQEKLIDYINNTKFNNSLISIISNYTGKVCNVKKDIIHNLCNQMSNRVRWVESIRTLERLNISNIIEIGPGKVLSGLIKRTSNKFNIKNIETIQDIKKFYEFES